MAEVASLFARRAALLRELAAIEEQLGSELEAALRRPVVPPPADETLDLEAAADFMGEAKETFRRRLEYRKAVISRPGQLRLRFSRRALERIRSDSLAANGEG